MRAAGHFLFSSTDRRIGLSLHSHLPLRAAIDSSRKFAQFAENDFVFSAFSCGKILYFEFCTPHSDVPLAQQFRRPPAQPSSKRRECNSSTGTPFLPVNKWH